MSHSYCLSHEIEEVDLTGDSKPKPSQSQNAHSKAQLCEPIRPWSLKNKTPFWSRKEDDSFRATEQPSTLMYPRDRTPHSDRHGRLDPGMASIKEQQQSDPDFDLAAEVINESNESSSELLILDRVKERLHHGDDAIKDMYAKIRTAGKTLDLVATGTAPKSRDPDVLAAAMRIIFKHLAGYLSRIEQAQQESRQRLTPLEAAIKSLVRAKAESAESERKRQAADEQMLDTVMFLKQCLDGHADLVDIVMGRPQPLVKQGMELMQGLLDEMFGLTPGPADEERVRESTEGPLPKAMEVAESEVEVDDRLEVQLEQQSESEVEYLWQTTQTEDLLNVEAEEDSGTESDESDEDAYDDDDDSISEGLDDYVDDDNTSECSNYSTAILPEHGRTSRRRKEKRDKVKRARDALWTRFGLRVEEAKEERDATQQHEDRSRVKRQKRNCDTMEEETVENNLTAQDGPPSLRQSTLSFNKVTKNRRLFSRRELKEQGILENEGPEEVEEEFETPKARGNIAKRMRAYWSQN